MQRKIFKCKIHMYLGTLRYGIPLLNPTGESAGSYVNKNFVVTDT